MNRLAGIGALALFLLTPVASAGAAESFFGGGEEIGVASPQSIAAGDFNADGRQDLAAVSYASEHVVVRLGAAGGGFTSAPNVTVGKGPSPIAVADFNGDGNDDLAVGNQGDRDVSVRLGVGDGTFTSAADVDLTRLPFAVVIGDFNADAREDLAIAMRDATGSEVTLRLGAGNGTFAAGGTVAAPAANLTVADFNSDGLEDLAYGALGNKPAAVLMGAVGGALTAGAEIALPGTANSADGWAAGDFNSDGRADVAAAVTGSDVVAVRLGSGDGKFSGGPDVPVGDRPYSVAVGDFDGDGNEDFATPNADGTTVSVRLGDGDGGFRAADDVPVGAGPTNLVLADFDADGSEDLAGARYGDGLVSVRYGSGPPALAGNLLANGGFEGAGAAGVFTQAPAIPGWERSGGITFARYGLPSHAFSPARLASPRYGTGGASLLWGGNSAATDGITEAFQSVDLSDAAASIDAGRATASLSAYLGGALAFNDRIAARAEFLGEAGGTLGSFEIGPVTATDRNNLTTLLRRQGSAPVPPGTRRVRVTLTSTDDDKTYSSALADNVRLTLDAPAVEQPAAAQAFGPDTRIRLRLAARRIKPRRPVRVRVSNGNPFEVAGSLGGRRLRPARLQLAANGNAVVRLRLPASLRRQLQRRHRLALRLTALVRDPAGNTRAVRKRAALRLTTRGGTR